MDVRGSARLEEQLSAELRDAGLRVTRPRLTVLRFFESEGGHYSADELLLALQDRGESLPRASVFSIVDALSQHGLLRVAEAGAGAMLYEREAEPHHHFVCRECGEIFDVPCVEGDDPCLSPTGVPGRVEEAQVIYRGVCRDCQ